MTRRRVALFLPSLAGGGAERCMLNVAGGLVDRLDVDLVLARDEGPLRSHVPDRVRTVPLGSRRTVGAVVPLARYLRETRPCGIYSAPCHANLVTIMAAQLARTGTQVIATEHLPPSSHSAQVDRARDRLLPMLMRRLYSKATVTAVSEGVAADLVDWVGLGPGSVTVVLNPVDIDDLTRKANAGTDHPWLALGGLPVVLAAGRLTAQKDFPTLLQAMARVRRTRDVRLIIIGEGEDRQALASLAQQLGIADAVDLHGHVENPYPFFAGASVYALSSRCEGLPTVLLEALALGLPIVATDCPSGPREILQGGALGRLVPVDDPEALAEAIEGALDHPQAPDPSGACAPYELSTVVDGYLALLDTDVSGADAFGTNSGGR